MLVNNKHVLNTKKIVYVQLLIHLKPYKTPTKISTKKVGSTYTSTISLPR